MDMPALPAAPAARQLAIPQPAARPVPPEMPLHVQTMDQLTTPQLREKFMALKRELQRTEFELVTVWSTQWPFGVVCGTRSPLCRAIFRSVGVLFLQVIGMNHTPKPRRWGSRSKRCGQSLGSVNKRRG